MHRVDELIVLLRDDIARDKAGLDEVLSKQLDPSLIFVNVKMWIKSAISLALIQWGRGNLDAAAEAFADCAAALEASEFHRKRLGTYPRVENARWSIISVYLLSSCPVARAPLLTDVSSDGYEPWFLDFFTDACTQGLEFDRDAYRAARDRWKKRRFPAARLALWDFYADVLAGEWTDKAPEMLAAHEEAFKLQSKIKLSNIETGDGEYNAYVPNVMFAAILKRIGYRGVSRHAWPA